MYDQGLGITDIGQVRRQLHIFYECFSGISASFHTEADNRARTFGQVFLGQRMASVLRKIWMNNPHHLLVILQKLEQFTGIFQVPVHSQRQGFNALQQQERVHQTHRESEIPHCLRA